MIPLRRLPILPITLIALSLVAPALAQEESAPAEPPAEPPASEPAPEQSAAPVTPVAPPAIESGTAAYIFRKDSRVVYYRDKTFVEEGQELVAPIFLSHFGADALSVMVAPTAILGINDILIPEGNEYIFNQQGQVIRSTSFKDTTIGNTLGTEVPGAYVEGHAYIELEGIFPVITIEEDRYGMRTITLAQNRWVNPEVPDSVHLYDGYRIEFREDSTMASVLSFNEFALNGRLTEPAQFGGDPNGGSIRPATALPPGWINAEETGVYINERGVKVNEYGLPIGRPSDEPAPEAPRPDAYSRGPIVTIGIIPFNWEVGEDDASISEANIPNYVQMVSEVLLEELANIEGLEVKILELAPEDQTGGTYVFNFAKRIGQKYGCDAIVHGSIYELGVIGDTNQRLVNQVKLTGNIEAGLIDTTGGRFNWQNSDRVFQFAQREVYERSASKQIHNLLGVIAKHFVADMVEQNLFAEREV